MNYEKSDFSFLRKPTVTQAQGRDQRNLKNRHLPFQSFSILKPYTNEADIDWVCNMYVT